MEAIAIGGWVLASGGWILAIIQFAELKKKNEADLLERTLGYFERGVNGRAIGLSIVEGVWLQDPKKWKRFGPVITPILISQLNYLLSEADHNRQDERTAIRLLDLLEKCIAPDVEYPSVDRIEVLEAIMAGAWPKGGAVSSVALRGWYGIFSLDEDWQELWDAETGMSEEDD